MQKAEVINKLQHLLVAAYGKIWEQEHNKPNYVAANLKSFGLSMLINPVAAVLITGIGEYNKQIERDAKSERLNLEIKSLLLNVISLGKFAYPELSPLEATLMAIMDVQIMYGEKRIYVENVDNGYGGKVLVSDACNKIASRIRTDEEILNR